MCTYKYITQLTCLYLNYAGRELQQKWKYIRDAYTRQVRLASSKGQGDGSKNYIYGKYLTFLKINPLQSRTANWTMAAGEAENKNLKAAKRRKYLRPTYSGIIRTKRYKPQPNRNIVSNQEPVTASTSLYTNVAPDSHNFLDKQSENDMNDDVAFFKSLLPTLSELAPSQKLLFRIDVMKILHSYATQSHIYTTENRAICKGSFHIEEPQISKQCVDDSPE